MIENILEMQGIFGIDGKEVVDLAHAGEVVLLIDSIDEKSVGFDSERALHFWHRYAVVLLQRKKSRARAKDLNLVVRYCLPAGHITSVIWRMQMYI
jgi:hypothetical protein